MILICGRQWTILIGIIVLPIKIKKIKKPLTHSGAFAILNMTPRGAKIRPKFIIKIITKTVDFVLYCDTLLYIKQGDFKMKYQFKNSDHKQRFSEKGEIQKEIAALVGLEPFDIDGCYIYANGSESRYVIPQAWYNTIFADIHFHCLEVHHTDDDGNETREHKIARLCHVIAHGKFQGHPAPSQLIISSELSLTFDDDRGSITVSALYDGHFCYDIFTQNEQESLHDAFETYKANKAKKEKEDFFMNVKF